MKRLLFAATAACLLFTTPTFAQKGVKGDPEIGKKLWNFNVLVKPHGWTDLGNACNGSRIFFDEDPSGGVGDVLAWKLDPAAQQNFEITDCNGTDGAASVLVDENQGNVIVAI